MMSEHKRKSDNSGTPVTFYENQAIWINELEESSPVFYWIINLCKQNFHEKEYTEWTNHSIINLEWFV